jgi:hypothetical protein
MKINEFEALSLPVKSKIVCEYGKLIKDKISNDQIVSIYWLFSFCVEVYCDREFTTIEDILVYYG